MTRLARTSDERARWLARYALPHEAALRAWLSGRRLPGLEIDDVVQETYARLSSTESVDAISNGKAYLFKTAYSVLSTHMRRSKVISFHTVADLDQLGAVAADPSPEIQTADRDELRRLAVVIAAMPRRAREVLLLRRVEGLSQREVAERLGISENTVEKHMGKGIRMLMEIFARGGFLNGRASMGADGSSSMQCVKAERKRD